MRTLACFAAILIASPVTAQTMKPLRDAVDQAAAPYPFSRCAGLYQSLMEWTGEERMGKETWDTMDQSRLLLIGLSATIAQEKAGGTFEQHAELAARDVRNIADLYLGRMEKNYATSGQAFGEDPLIQSDMPFCREIVEAIQ